MHAQIFRDTRQRVVFAFHLTAHPGETTADNASMVLMALREAGAHVPPMIDRHELAELREHAQAVLAAIYARLMPVQAAALIARYSKNWPERRTACHLLRAHLQRPVEKLLDNPPAVEKLVLRHYIVERDRTNQWEVGQIAAEHHASEHQVRQAWSVLVLYADQLERAALEALAHAIEGQDHA